MYKCFTSQHRKGTRKSHTTASLSTRQQEPKREPKIAKGVGSQEDEVMEESDEEEKIIEVVPPKLGTYAGDKDAYVHRAKVSASFCRAN